ncbi:DDE-type integrase/transposase/recombinase, partial [Bacillus bingmayongensis]|uniref:DDE-type integrase/transposase/recombinase n=1 Tax=Bacillus bingmayongensis TaxID=1150157 RepID=UPI001C8D2266
THCTIKHLNNLIEQDHRHVKRRFSKSAGFQNLRHASRTLKGIETIHALYKRTRSLGSDFGFSTYNKLQELLTIA